MIMRRSDALLGSGKRFGSYIESIVAQVAAQVRQSTPVKLRLLVALTALLLMLISVRSALAEPTSNSAVEPVIVFVPLGDPIQQLQPKSQARVTLIQTVVQELITAQSAQPDRPMVLWVRRSPLRFNRLAEQHRQVLTKTHGDDAAQWYEQSLADFLGAVVDEAHRRDPQMTLSVYGLPIEQRSAVTAGTNVHYADLIQRLDVLVSGKNIIALDDTASPSAIAERSLSAAMATRGERAVFYRVNSQWRIYTNDTQSGQWTDHTAQDSLRAAAKSTLDNNPEIASILQSHGINPQTLERNGDDRGNSGNAYNQADLLALLAQWGQADSPWDINGDGTVNVFDLLILLRNWQGSVEPDNGIARFTAMDTQYMIGSSAVIEVELLGDAPANANVVFQTWSDVTNSIESPYLDTSAPFMYPSAALDAVTPGQAEVQALIRDADDNVVLRLTARVEFMTDSPDEPGPIGGDDPLEDDPSGGKDPGEPTGDDDDIDPSADQWGGLFDELDETLIALLQPIELPAQPVLNNPQQIMIRSAGDIPNPVPSNSVLTVEGEIEISDASSGFVFTQGTSDVIVRFMPDAKILYTGGFSDRAIFQFRSTSARIRIENPVIVGRLGTRNTCHAFATMFGSSTPADITIIGGDVSGVRYTFQGEGGCERLLITGLRTHNNWEYFVWGSNNMVSATFCHNVVDGVAAQHGIRLAPGVDGVNIVNNDIRIGQQGLIKRSIWIAGADNVSILGNHTRDGRITIGPNPVFNEPGPTGVVLAGNTIEHDRNNLSIELFTGTKDVFISANIVTTPHSNWMQIGTVDKFNRPFENIRWSEDNIANSVQRYGFDGIRVSPAFVGRPDIGPVD